MAEQGDYPGGRGPGYTQAAGFGPNGQNPRMRPPATPEQWQGRAPRGAPPAGQPQYPPRQDPQPAFTPDPWRGSQQPGGQYPPPQPAWRQPNQPPQEYAPQPPQSPRKSRKGLAFLGCGGFAAIFILIAALAGSHSTSSSPPAAASSPQASLPAASQQAAPPAQPAAKAPAVAKTVATFTGSGIQNTPQFIVTGTWKLDYSFNCADFGYAGNFVVDEDGGSDLSGLSVNDLAMSKSSSTWAYDDAGTHYLAVNSECSWTMKVIDEG
jgi:hypothetical protein